LSDFSTRLGHGCFDITWSPLPSRTHPEFVVTGTVASFQTALWICVVIGIGALIFSLILKPKPGPIVPVSAGRTH